jgi:hypothetical protein
VQKESDAGLIQFHRVDVNISRLEGLHKACIQQQAKSCAIELAYGELHDRNKR